MGSGEGQPGAAVGRCPAPETASGTAGSVNKLLEGPSGAGPGHSRAWYQLSSENVVLLHDHLTMSSSHLFLFQIQVLKTDLLFKVF